MRTYLLMSNCILINYVYKFAVVKSQSVNFRAPATGVADVCCVHAHGRALCSLARIKSREGTRLTVLSRLLFFFFFFSFFVVVVVAFCVGVCMCVCVCGCFFFFSFSSFFFINQTQLFCLSMGNQPLVYFIWFDYYTSSHWGRIRGCSRRKNWTEKRTKKPPASSGRPWLKALVTQPITDIPSLIISLSPPAPLHYDTATSPLPPFPRP